MAMTDRRSVEAEGAAGPTPAPRRFRPAGRRRARIAAGAALAAVAVGGNVLVYSSLDDTTEVVQVVSNIRAGAVVTSDDLRIVEVDVDASVPVVRADQIGLVVNQYARTFIASGTLIVPQLVQSTPLVTPGAAIVALEVRPTAVPAGLRERSRIQLVVEGEDGRPRLVTEARVVARGAEPDSVTGVFALSVELAESDAAALVNADDVGIVLLDPGSDATTADGAGAEAAGGG